MKAHRRKRLGVILFVAAGLSVAVGLTLYALSQNIDLFYTPTQVAQGEVNAGQRIRIGGMVREGSVQSAADSLAVRFVATDYANDVPIYHEGILPDLFREGQGMWSKGVWTMPASFRLRASWPSMMKITCHQKSKRPWMPPAPLRRCRYATGHLKDRSMIPELGSFSLFLRCV